MARRRGEGECRVDRVFVAETSRVVFGPGYPVSSLFPLILDSSGTIMADVKSGSSSRAPRPVRSPPWARDGSSSTTEAAASATDSAGPATTPTAPEGEADSSVEGSSRSNETPADASSSAPTPASGASATPTSSTATDQHPDSAQMPYETPPPPRPTWQPPHTGWSPTSPPSRITLLSDLKRLSYVFSLVLGSSAVIGLFFSTFILPLLHSTFSARGALMDQQAARWGRLVRGLRALRASTLLPPAKTPAKKLPSNQDGVLVESGGEDAADSRPALEHAHRSGIEEIPSSASSLSDKDRDAAQCHRPKAIASQAHHEPPKWRKDDADIDGDFDANAQQSTHHLLPIANLTALSTSLSALSDSISSTSTTRVSLLSTLESYTSQLHREVYLRSDGFGSGSGGGSSFSVGLGSLSQNLASAGAKAGGASGANGTGGTGRTDWDDVRREVRAVKGLLLGRRNFVPAR